MAAHQAIVRFALSRQCRRALLRPLDGDVAAARRCKAKPERASRILTALTTGTPTATTTGRQRRILRVSMLSFLFQLVGPGCIRFHFGGQRCAAPIPPRKSKLKAYSGPIQQGRA